MRRSTKRLAAAILDRGARHSFRVRHERRAGDHAPSHERAHRRADGGAYAGTDGSTHAHADRDADARPDGNAGADSGAPTPAEPTPTPAPPVPAGTYTYVDADGGEWKLELRNDGLFTITDPDGKPHTGEGWSTAADGSVHCGPTDIYFAPFAFNGGCSRWKICGNTCTPLERA